MRRASAAVVATLALGWLWGMQALAQNDWQFPDPYFGILEIEKSRPSGPVPRARVQPRGPGDVGAGGVARPAWARRRLWRPAAASGSPAATGAASGRR